MRLKSSCLRLEAVTGAERDLGTGSSGARAAGPLRAPANLFYSMTRGADEVRLPGPRRSGAREAIA